MEKEKRVQISVMIDASAKKALVEMSPGKQAIGYTLSEIIKQAHKKNMWQQVIATGCR